MIKKHLTGKSKLLLVIIVVVGILFVYLTFEKPTTAPTVVETNEKITGTFDKSKFKSDDEWKKILTPKQFEIVRQKGTEVPFTGDLLDEKRAGTYYSVGCDQPVFRSDTKFESGTGWPSFWEAISSDALVLKEDNSIGGTRIEVMDKCGGHLGHVFDDGPAPTGKRYCMNSEALYFVPDK